MPTPLEAMLVRLSEVAKEKLDANVLCPSCGERHCFIKHGFYHRYLFTGDETTKIQRYRCLNPSCSRCTFSCLPHPFLPIIRWPLCALMAVLSLLEQPNETIASVGRSCGKSWATIQRAARTAQRLRQWLAQEARAALWGPSLCLGPKQTWPSFTHALSFAFFPGRF